MQGYKSAPSRNETMNTKVSVPAGNASLGKAPSPGVTGSKPGSAVAGFSGGVKEAKIKV